MRWILLTMFLTTSGCLGNFSLSDLATGGGAVAGAGVSAALSLEPTLAVTSTVIGAIAGAAVVGPQEESVVDQLAAVPEEERADALRTLTIINTIKELGYWAIAAVLAFFLIPLLVGYFIPRRSERKMKEALFDNPDIRMKDLK